MTQWWSLEGRPYIEYGVDIPVLDVALGMSVPRPRESVGNVVNGQ